MNSLLDRVLITEQAAMRWYDICAKAAASWQGAGYQFSPSDVEEEQAELRGDTLVVFALFPGGRVEMTLQADEWAWRPRQESMN